MNENLSIVIQARDATGAGIRAAQRGLGNLGTAAQRAAGHITRAMQGAQRAVVAVGAAAQRVTGVLQQMGQAAGIAAATGVGTLSAAMALVARRGVEMNLTVSGAHTALTQILGSSQAAGRFLGDLQREAAQSIPTLKDLLPIALQLAQAYGPQNLGKVIPTIRAFADAASIAAGGDTNRMSMALLGFRQLLSRGVPQQEELNQIGENLGVSVTNILKQAFGTADTEVLQQANVTGAQVADALVAGLQRQFGGAQLRQAGMLPGLTSNIEDAFNSISGRVTGGLMAGLQRGAATLLQLLNRFQQSASGAQIMETVARGFAAVGDAVAYAASKFPALIAQVGPLMGGLGQGVAQLVRLFADLAGNQKLLMSIQGGLANIGALLQTIVQAVFKIDWSKTFDPNSVIRFFNFLWEGTKAAISGFFATGRVVQEFTRIGRSAIQDLGDQIRDVAKDTELGFRAAFIAIDLALRGLTASALVRFAEMIEALTPFRGLLQRVGLDIGNTSGLRAQAMMTAAGGLDQSMALSGELAQEKDFRLHRGNERFNEDPRRAMSFMDRFKLAAAPDAFERKFFADLAANAQGLFNGMRGGMPAVAAVPQGPYPAAPQLYGAPRPPSISYARPGPAIPAYPGGMVAGPPTLTADQIYQQQYGQRAGAGQTVIVVNGMTREAILAQMERVLDEQEREASYGRRR